MIDLGPSCFPRPISIIFIKPLSMSPTNPVWGLMRFTTITLVGLEGVTIEVHVEASAVRQTTTVSMLERIGSRMILR